MSSEDSHNWVISAFTYFYAYFNAVAEEIGLAKATALDTQVSEMFGTRNGQVIKEETGLDVIDLATSVDLLYTTIEEQVGISSEVVEEDSQRIVSRIGRCPIYEAAQAMEMDNEAIEANCRASMIHYMDTMIKQFNPDLSCRLVKFRTSADDHCIEEVVLG